MSARSADADHVVEVGANFARLRVLWDRVEPQRDVFDAAEVARIQATVDELDGDRVFIELDLRGRPAPAWFGSTRKFFSSNRRASHAAYLGFVAAVVRRFDTDPWLIGYGIFNEPEHSWNGGGFGRPGWTAGCSPGTRRSATASSASIPTGWSS